MKGYILKAIEIPNLNADYNANGLECPNCHRKLQMRKHGYVCVNWNCELYSHKHEVFFTNNIYHFDHDIKEIKVIR